DPVLLRNAHLTLLRSTHSLARSTHLSSIDDTVAPSLMHRRREAKPFCDQPHGGFRPHRAVGSSKLRDYSSGHFVHSVLETCYVLDSVFEIRPLPCTRRSISKRARPAGPFHLTQR